ncbi:hypothetical protein [Klebsiella variicola]|uniref:hypothetical protein n=1 Tax=Klebsiella variicola TaxID=244366 RepID=UPI00209F5DA1|nr:hypothetical protein [Klebsiella variicola]MDZ2608973.1 hypothetical protein [Klebsiella variicola]UTA78173.1 hypothetical protein KGB1_27440 [Klebsiella variicola]HCB9206816.1 hypothetical protein [Klebsiella variicola]HDK6447831.1 hypothetical protein [Klebsiella variicola]
MPVYLSKNFVEFPHGEITAHRFDFCIEAHKFLVIFAEVITSDPAYHAYRSDEVGFHIPDRCYDVKFDRVENFESGDFYKQPPLENRSRRLNFTEELAEALETIITLHHNVYHARAYFAVAETTKLKRFYDRILQQPPHDVVYEVNTDLGEGGMGYALKTRYFNS